MNRMDGKVCVVTGGDAGPRRGDRAAACGGGRRGDCRSPGAMRSAVEAVAEIIAAKSARSGRIRARRPWRQSRTAGA